MSSSYGASPTIRDNTITANYCDNIDVEVGTPTILNNEVSGALKANGGPDESYCDFPAGINLEATPNSLNGLGSAVVGNTIENNLTGPGINLWAGQNVLIMHNTIRNNASPGVGSAINTANSQGTVVRPESDLRQHLRLWWGTSI